MPSSTKRTGYALSFNGQDDYVNITESPSLYTNQLGIAFWLKISSLPNNYSRIITKSDDSSNGFTVLFDASRAKKVYFSIRNEEGKEFNTAVYSKPIPIDVWRHYAFVCYGSKIVSYEDGVPTGTMMIKGKYNPDIANNLVFGRASNSVGGYAAMVLDDVRMYERALSPKDVNDIFMGKDMYRDIVGHWTFDEGSGTIAVDNSPFGNDGIIVGAKFVEPDG